MTRGRVLAGVGLLAGTAWIVALCAGSYFTSDDHLFFIEAREQPFGWHFLSQPIHDHFSPWHRLQDALVTSLTHQGWWLALAISVAWYAAAVVAFAVLVRRLVGPHPAGAVVIGIFAFSPLGVELAQWWGLGAQTFPELVFLLVTAIGGLRWQACRRPRDLVLTVAAFALALLGFIKGLLALPLLVLVLYLRPETAGSLRDRVRRAWREDRALWGALAVVTAVYLVFISGDRYYRYIGAGPQPTVELWLKYLVAGWGEGIVPLALDGTVPEALGAGNLAVVVIANLVVVAIVALTVRARPAAAWTWAGAGVVVLGTLALGGGARLGEYGVEFVALDPRYNFEGAVVLLLAGALTARAAWPEARRLATPAVAGVALVAVVFAVDSGLRREREWAGPIHRAYFDSFARTLAAAPGVDVIESTTPPVILSANVAPLNRLSSVLPLREPSVRVGTLTGPPAFVDGSGRVTPVDLEPVASAPAGCEQIDLRVDTPPSDDFLVLTLRRSDAAAPADLTIFADTGLPDGHQVRGVPLPAIFELPVHLEAGRRDLRAVVSAGQTREIAVYPSPCVDELRVERFSPPGRPSGRP